MVALVIGLIVATIVIAIFVWAQQPGGLPFVGGGSGGEITYAPTPTISSWNELDPEPEPTPTPTPTPPPPPPPPPKPTTLVACPWSVHGGDRGTPQPDGWVASGKMMARAISGAGWQSGWGQGGLPPAYDVNGDSLTVYPGWYSVSAVARLSADDGFDDPAGGAEMMLDCFAHSDLYAGFAGREDVSSEAVTVSGRPGWHIRANVYVELPELPQVEGDVVDVVVVDLDGRDLGVYLSACTIGDQRVCDQVREAMRTLTVSG